MIPHSDPHGSFDHQVKFLTGVGGGADGLILQLRRILIGDPVGGSQLLMEESRHVLNGDAVLAGSDQSLSLAGHGVAGQLWAGAFQQVRQLNAEDLGAFMHKGKGEVSAACLIFPVEIFGNAGFLRHFPSTQVHYGAHFTNSLRHLHKLKRCVLSGHMMFIPS